MDTRERYWLEYYEDVARTGSAWLDYSNERVQSQTFGLTVEAAGPVRGKACLDLGCGRGTFVNMLAALGAQPVTGVDLVPDMIAANARAYPHVRWVQGTLPELDARGELDTFDLIVLLEVLQYVPLERTLQLAWRHMRPGGRLIAVFPNIACPIVRHTRHRFDANYAPPALDGVVAQLASEPDSDAVQYRGLTFGADQRLVPYDVSQWQSRGRWPSEPNRIQVIAHKTGGQPRPEPQP